VPIYAFECTAGHLFERYAPLARFTEKTRCPSCRRLARLTVRARRGPSSGFAPVVVHRHADGHYSFPAHTSAPLRLGYERVELRSLAEVRKFEKQVNAVEFRKHVEHKEREERSFGRGRAERQAELRSLAQHMTPMGRDFAHVAMEATNRKSRSRDAARFEAGFYVEAFSNDRSSLADYRDQKTGWKERR
jgi:hypothetical protein